MSDQPITVEIDPNAPLPARYLGSDEDGPHYAPVTMYDAIVDAAAVRLAERVEKEAVADVIERIGEAASSLIAERLPGMIDDALAGEVTATDTWGNERSRGTLREQIVKYAQKQLKTTSNSSWNETVLDKAIKEHIGYSLSKELAEAVAAAKKKLLGELTRQTSESLSKAIFTGITKDRL